MPTRRHMLLFVAAVPAVGLLGCGSEDEITAADCAPAELNDGHECHLCGMTIVNHPGPKGQACLRDGRTLRFCSTRDLLSWAWQPESGPAIAALFVHDLSRTGWDEPSDDAWTGAKETVYVVGHDRRGAMGHTPASFSRRGDADAFTGEHGGRVLAFDELDWDTLRDEPANGGGHGGSH